MMSSISSFSSLFAERSPDVQPCKREKYLQHASQMWDTFYTAHAAKFYKDRHYFEREWPELTAGPAVLLEVGCGAGNTIYPLLEINPGLKVYACDFSHVAVGLVKSHPNYSPDVIQAFVADLSSTDLCQHVPGSTMDFVTCVFVLSALQPHHMPAAVANMACTLRPGGQLLFRDYAEGDLAQEKREAAGARRLGERFFLRGDGTCCYHFQPEELCALFAAAGFKCTQLRMHERSVENRKRGIIMHRKWVQASFTLMQPPPPFPPPPGCMPAFPPVAVTTTTTATGTLPTTGTPPAATLPDILPTRPLPTVGTIPTVRTLPTAGALPATGSLASSTLQPGAAAAGSSSAAAQTQAAGEGQCDVRAAGGSLLGGTWLTGAAARLATHATLPPGMPSGRAQLPDTLDSADELMCTLSPRAVQQQSVHQVLQPVSAAAALSPAKGGHQQEADLEADFFATIGRRTEDVVAEEVAAAGIAGITLMDVSNHAGTAQQQQQQLQPAIPPAQVADDMDTDMDDHINTPQEVHVHAGVHFLTTDAAVAAAVLPPHGSSGLSMVQHKGWQAAVSAATAELLLARLLLHCSRSSAVSGTGAARQLQQALQGGQVLQLATGPGALAGMCVVRHCGGRRVLLTHPSRLHLEQAASCVHVNAPRLVIERIRLAQLDLNQEHTISNVLQQVAQHGGASLVVCADWATALGLADASVDQDITATGVLQEQLLQLVRLAALGQLLPSRSSAVSALATHPGPGTTLHSKVQAVERSTCSGRPAMFLLLAAKQHHQSMSSAASAAGWVVDTTASAELQQLLLALASEAQCCQVAWQPLLLHVQQLPT